jgi:ribonucleoside-diphosphate reductase alpha chain
MEFIPGYRGFNAPHRGDEAGEAADPTDAADAAKSLPARHSRGGNGHGTRHQSDAPKAIDGLCADEALRQSVVSPAPVPAPTAGVNLRLAIVADPLSQQGSEMQADAPACDVCGSITVRSGTCYKCLNCGNSMGCS